MLKDKSLLDQELEELVSTPVFDMFRDDITDYIYKKHNVSKATTMDYLTLRASFREADPIMEYAILEAMAESDYKNFGSLGKFSRAALNGRKQAASEKISEYFTELEKGKFSVWKEAEKKTPTEFRIPCLQVSDNQWIGATDIRFFITLRDLQKIRYNENAQRVMKKIVKGESIEYAITINKKEIDDIQQKYAEEKFIPNVLTLNIPEDVDTEFYYNEKTKELIFTKITFLDITDGYHRYLAAGAEYDRTNGEFNYPTEIRIINFSDKKARDFVYQETLGTKMKKVEAQSMNSSSPSNFIVDRINEQSDFEGLIKRNNGIINYSDLSACILNICLDKQKYIPRPELVDFSKKAVKFFNILSSADEKFLVRTWSYIQTVSVTYLLNYYVSTDKPKINTDNIVMLLDKYSELLIFRATKNSIKAGGVISKNTDYMAKDLVVEILEDRT